jgi:opine dehydrogenase
MAPHLVDGQVVFLPPGTFGAFTMPRIVRAAATRADLAWAETGTLPYLARKHGPREVNVTIRAIHLPTGVYPARHAERALAVIRAAYPAVHGCGDALSGALMNAGPIIHPPLMVMNAAPLQHFPKRWDIHTEGTQPAVRAVTDRLDQERIAVREALGYGAPHYPLADHYDNDRWMYGDAHKKLQKSGDWREHIDLHTHRYVTEDTELGLAFLASVARWAGTDAPIAQGLLAITGGFLGRDLRQGPRTLETLGLASDEPGAAAARCCTTVRQRLRVTGPLPRFAAVGAGRMGRGIAIAFAYAGHRIALVDLRPAARPRPGRGCRPKWMSRSGVR